MASDDKLPLSTVIAKARSNDKIYYGPLFSYL